MDNKPLNFDSPSVTSYLGILQGVITRMATNSTSCKTWCISLVSAIIVIVADKGKPTYIWISMVPIALFFILDAYYLALEQQFRGIYNAFVRKLHYGDATVDDIFLITPRERTVAVSANIARAAFSMATWVFYALLAVMLIVVRAWVL